MLKGQAKKDYQRKYMREYRRKGKMLDPTVRPLIDAVSPSVRREGYGKASSTVSPSTPELDADGNVMPRYV